MLDFESFSSRWDSKTSILKMPASNCYALENSLSSCKKSAGRVGVAVNVPHHRGTVMNPANRVCLRQCGPRKYGFCLLPHAEQLATGAGERIRSPVRLDAVFASAPEIFCLRFRSPKSRTPLLHLSPSVVQVE